MARPDPAQRPAAPAKRRSYLGNGFTLEVPSRWSDLSVYAFRGPELKQFEPILLVQLEENVGGADVERYARPRLAQALRAASGSRLTRRERVRLDGGVAAVRAEIRAFAPDESRTYTRLLYVVANETGFLLSTVLSRHARLARSQEIDGVMASVRFPLGGSAPAPADHTRADRFSLRLPEGWHDESLVMFAEPDARRFRRTLVVKRDAGEAAAPDEAEWARAEIAILEESVPGFELISHQETATLDGGSAQMLAFRRGADQKHPLRHLELMAWRHGTRYTAMVTTENQPPPAIERTLVPMLRSLAAQPPERTDGPLRV